MLRVAYEFMVDSGGNHRSRLSAADVAAVLGAVGGVAGVGAWATQPVVGSQRWDELEKPSWQPPDAVFGPVWSVLYALIATSMLIVRRRVGWHRALFVLYGSNLALNLAWTLIFFRGRSPVAAGVEIVVLEGHDDRPDREERSGVAARQPVPDPLCAVGGLCHRVDLDDRGAESLTSGGSVRARVCAHQDQNERLSHSDSMPTTPRKNIDRG